MAKKKTKRVTPEEFIKAWQASESATGAAKQLGLSITGATSRASLYRKNGVPLKHMSKGHANDWKALAALTRKVK